MIKIDINKIDEARLRPEDLIGMPYGEVYEMKGSTDLFPSYFLTCGGSMNPILFWYNQDEKIYEVCPADLVGYSDHIYVEKINCEVLISLEVKS